LGEEIGVGSVSRGENRTDTDYPVMVLLGLARLAVLGRKYRHALSHPWETIEPDPPLLGRH
jgi:hypothetical protein